MSNADKLLQKLKKEPPPKDFTWDELKVLLCSIGFEPKQGNGSRVKFIHPDLKRYVIEQIKDALDELSLG